MSKQNVSTLMQRVCINLEVEEKQKMTSYQNEPCVSSFGFIYKSRDALQNSFINYSVCLKGKNDHYSTLVN